MLTHTELVELYRELRDEKVLSIYVDGTVTEFSEKNVWRKRLEHQIAEARKSVNGAAKDEEAFKKALALLQGELEEVDRFIPGRGWVGFATPDRLCYAKPVQVPMPDLARWERGIRVAPYVRALKQERVVVTILLDSRRARIFRYQDAELHEPEDLLAETFMGDLSDVNVSKRGTNRSGVRGKTGTDASQTVLEVSEDRLHKKLMEVVTEMVGSRGFLVIGGTPEAVSRAAQEVPKSMAPRVAERPSLRVEMTNAELKPAVEEAASAITQSMQDHLLEDVLNLAGSGGRGSIGKVHTEQALREQRVETLLLSRSFIQADPEYADRCVGTAFEQQAEVEELSNRGAERLDREGDGIAARLRYVIQEGNGASAE
ncbi:MAG: hypothetical protein WDZ89_02810 [Gemmatimonadota bacterium]